jgi:hypothetical protein
MQSDSFPRSTYERRKIVPFPRRGYYKSKIEYSKAKRTTSNGGNGGGDGTNERVARLESDVGHIRTGIEDIKSDVRSIRDSGAKASDVQDVRNDMREIRTSIDKLLGRGGAAFSYIG